MSQPATVNGLIDAALDAGATSLKPAAKSLWGYGGVVQAPDGTIWKVATSAKKDTGPATRQIDEIVLLLGVADVAASKRFYVDRGLAVAKSFGRKYVEFATAVESRQAGALRAPRPGQGRRRRSRRHRIAPARDRQRRRALHRPGRVRVGGRSPVSRAAQHDGITRDRRHPHIARAVPVRRTRVPALARGSVPAAGRRTIVQVTSSPASEQHLRDLARLRRVRDRIDRDYAQPLDVEALARGVHMSAGHLSREFRLAYGESPYGYLMTRRIERAMALLRRGDLSVTEVCFAVGCSSLGHVQHPVHRAGRCVAQRLPARARRSATAGMPSCVAKQVTDRSGIEKRRSAEPHLA